MPANDLASPLRAFIVVGVVGDLIHVYIRRAIVVVHASLQSPAPCDREIDRAERAERAYDPSRIRRSPVGAVAGAAIREKGALLLSGPRPAALKAWSPAS